MATASPARRRWQSLAWRIVRLPLLTYAALLIMMMWFENTLLLHPSKYPAGVWNPAGLTLEDAWFTGEDGTKLHGWYVEHDEPRAVVLFAHGNAGNVTHRAERLRNLHRHGMSVLVFDYRGFGRSEGAADARNILTDARAARAWLAQRAGIDPRDIVLWGESLGGGVAVDLAAKEGARGLVLESTFNSLPEIAAYHYPWLPVRWLMRSRIDNEGQIALYQGPLLWSHGTADTIIPYQFGHKLFLAANEPKIAVTFEGGEHNGPPHPEHRQLFRDALEKFLDGLAPLAGAKTIVEAAAEASGVATE
jgi:hypothetical protein